MNTGLDALKEQLEVVKQIEAKRKQEKAEGILWITATIQDICGEETANGATIVCVKYFDVKYQKEGLKKLPMFAASDLVDLLVNQIQPGRTYHIKTKKNEKGFRDWLEVEEVSNE